MRSATDFTMSPTAAAGVPGHMTCGVAVMPVKAAQACDPVQRRSKTRSCPPPSLSSVPFPDHFESMGTSYPEESCGSGSWSPSLFGHAATKSCVCAKASISTIAQTARFNIPTTTTAQIMCQLPIAPPSGGVFIAFSARQRQFFEVH